MAPPGPSVGEIHEFPLRNIAAMGQFINVGLANSKTLR